MQPGEFEAPRISFFPSIKATLNHILAVDLLYLDMLEEGGVGAGVFDDFVPSSTMQPCSPKRRRRSIARLIEFCDRLSAVDLDRRVITDRREDGQIPERIGDLLAHLFIHQIHHRGQVHAMLSGTSVKPPQLDEFFLDYDLHLRREEVARLGMAN